MQAKPLCQPAIDSNCLRKMMDQKSAWATNYSKWEADYRVSITLFILIIRVVILTTCSGGEREEQRKEDRNQRFWPDWKVGLEGSSGQGSGGGRHQRPLHRPRLHGVHVQARLNPLWLSQAVNHLHLMAHIIFMFTPAGATLRSRRHPVGSCR